MTDERETADELDVLMEIVHQRDIERQELANLVAEAILPQRPVLDDALTEADVSRLADEHDRLDAQMTNAWQTRESAVAFLLSHHGFDETRRLLTELPT